jgi:hypothetical protein
VGAPSYTSGVHMWKGTVESLKPTALNTRVKSKTWKNEILPEAATVKASLITSKLVEPDRP